MKILNKKYRKKIQELAKQHGYNEQYVEYLKTLTAYKKDAPVLFRLLDKWSLIDQYVLDSALERVMWEKKFTSEEFDKWLNQQSVERENALNSTTLSESAKRYIRKSEYYISGDHNIVVNRLLRWSEEDRELIEDHLLKHKPYTDDLHQQIDKLYIEKNFSPKQLKCVQSRFLYHEKPELLLQCLQTWTTRGRYLATIEAYDWGNMMLEIYTPILTNMSNHDIYEMDRCSKVLGFSDKKIARIAKSRKFNDDKSGSMYIIRRLQKRCR